MSGRDGKVRGLGTHSWTLVCGEAGIGVVGGGSSRPLPSLSLGQMWGTHFLLLPSPQQANVVESCTTTPLTCPRTLLLSPSQGRTPHPGIQGPHDLAPSHPSSCSCISSATLHSCSEPLSGHSSPSSIKAPSPTPALPQAVFLNSAFGPSPLAAWLAPRPWGSCIP